MKKLLFVINPTSGIGKQKKLSELINEHIDRSVFRYDIIYTEFAGHASNIAAQYVNDYDCIVAAGGDGTVNEIAQNLVDTNTKLAIIPIGSGNGLARHLKIPTRRTQALAKINAFHSTSMDVGVLNEHYFFNVSGIGFDGHISHLFAKEKKRGILGYSKLVLQELHKYAAQEYQISVDGQTWQQKAFLIAFANSPQYGNNIHIAPHATIDDGMLDLCVIEDFPIHMAPYLGLRLLSETLWNTSYSKTIRGEKIEIQSEQELRGHIDGDPFQMGKHITLSIKALALDIIS